VCAALEAIGTKDAVLALVKILRSVKPQGISSLGYCVSAERGDDYAPAMHIAKIPNGLSIAKSACTSAEIDRILVLTSNYSGFPGRDLIPELEAWGTPHAVGCLVECLRQAPYGPSLRAKAALVRLGGKAHQKLVMELARTTCQTPIDQSVFWTRILDVLSQSGDTACLKAIQRLEKETSSAHVRSACAEAIEQISRRSGSITVQRKPDRNLSIEPQVTGTPLHRAAGNGYEDVAEHAKATMDGKGVPIKTYTNRDWKFTIDYPADWQVAHENIQAGEWHVAVGIAGPKIGNGTVGFIVNARKDPLMAKAGGWSFAAIGDDGTRVNLFKTSQEFVEKSMKELASSFVGFTFESSDELEVAGHPSVRIRYSYDGNTGRRKEMSVTRFGPFSTFQFICEAPSEGWASVEPIFQRMIDSTRPSG
jgi:hypothetical protein